MNILSLLYQIVRADVLERIRRYSFLITLGLATFAAYAYLPPSTAGYLTLGLGNARGIYNSAWVGSAIALLTSTLLSLPGFYLVKNAVERDFQTGVGQILATTPLRKSLYTLGKALSNFIVLTALVGIIIAAALGMQLIRGEDRTIEVWALLAPFIFVTLPTMALIASLAVLFEVITWLRGTFGAVVYFVFWMATLLFTVAVSSQAQQSNLNVSATTDIFGVMTVLSSMQAMAKVVFPGYHGGFAIGGTAVQGHVQTFVWQGVHWTSTLVLGRLLWVGVALGVALVAAFFFHRFDPAFEKKKPVSLPAEPLTPLEERAVSPVLPPIHLTPLTRRKRRLRLSRGLQAEFRLMLKGTPWWWYIVALGLIVAGWFVPAGEESLLLALAWIWPLQHWAALGNRENAFHTKQLIFVAPHPLLRQLPTMWLAGGLLSAMMGSGVAGHLLLERNWAGLLAWIVGVLFIPTLAICLGIWSGSPKLFEVIYLLLWYLGPVNHFLPLDYTGMTKSAMALPIPVIYLLGTVILLTCAVVGRKHQMAD